MYVVESESKVESLVFTLPLFANILPQRGYMYALCTRNGLDARESGQGRVTGRLVVYVICLHTFAEKECAIGMREATRQDCLQMLFLRTGIRGTIQYMSDGMCDVPLTDSKKHEMKLSRNAFVCTRGVERVVCGVCNE